VKNIPLFSCFVIVFLSFSAAAHGEINIFGEPYTFSLSTGPAFLYGTSYEIVYRNSTSDAYLSELQWNMKPLWFLQTDFTLSPQNPMKRWGLFMGLEVSAALPMESGVIEDRDWLIQAQPGVLTHFSSHENHTKAAVMVSLESGFSLPVWKLLLKLYLNVDYMYFKWEARNGYTQYGSNKNKPYGPWDPSFTQDPFWGLCITYQQHWLLINTGIGADFPIGPFTFSGALFFTPAVFCIDIDEHHARIPPFTATGYLYKGMALKPKLEAAFSFNDHFALELSYSYLWIGETRGHEKIEESGQTYYNKNSVGARFSALEGGIGLRFRF
jgi:outer membrane protease